MHEYFCKKMYKKYRPEIIPRGTSLLAFAFILFL